MYMGTVNNSNKTWHVVISVVDMRCTWIQSTIATRHGMW